MSTKHTGRRSLALGAFVIFTLAYTPAWAGDKTAPGSRQFGEAKVAKPTTAQDSSSLPLRTQQLNTSGMAALPNPPKHYKLDPEAGQVKFGDGQQGSRLPTGQGASVKPRTGQMALGGPMVLPAPPVKGPGALGSMPLPPPKGVSPADPTSPGIPGGVAERGIIVQDEPGASKGSDTVPTESLSLNYDKIKEDYAPQGPGKSKGNVETTWKVEEGEK